MDEDKEIERIKNLAPDLLEIRLAQFIHGLTQFIHDVDTYLFKKKKSIMDLLIFGGWAMLTLAVVIRLTQGSW